MTGLEIHLGEFVAICSLLLALATFIWRMVQKIVTRLDSINDTLNRHVATNAAEHAEFKTRHRHAEKQIDKLQERLGAA